MSLEALEPKCLENLMRKCRRNSEYKGMVVFSTHQRLDEFMSEIMKINREVRLDGVKCIMKASMSGDIIFKNGSTIYARVFRSDVETSVYGRKMDTILFDSDISTTKQNDIIRGCYTDTSVTIIKWSDIVSDFKQRAKQGSTETNSSDDNALDDFLNTFTINS